VPGMVGLISYFEKNGYKSPASSTNGPVQHAFNTPLETFAYWGTLPGVIENFNTYMMGVRAARPTWSDWFPVREELLQEVNTKEGVLLIDIGGGRGHDIGKFEKKFGGDIEGKGRLVLQDLPAVINDIKDLSARIERMPYDFFTLQPLKGGVPFISFSSVNGKTDRTD